MTYIHGGKWEWIFSLADLYSEEHDKYHYHHCGQGKTYHKLSTDGGGINTQVNLCPKPRVVFL